MIFTELAKRPINGVNPAGSNPNDTDDFLNLKRQINKMNAVTASFSWRKIYSLSEKILSKSSKDFRCASYYTAAATHINGLKGLVDGLQVLHDLSVIYWHSATPEHHKEKARIDAFSWMIEHTEKNQKKIKIKENDLLLIESGHRLTLKIDEELKLHYGISAPSLGPLRRIFSTWIEEIEDIKEAKRKKSAPIQQPQQQQEPIKLDLSLTNEKVEPPVSKKVEKPAPLEKEAPVESTKPTTYIFGVVLLLILTFFTVQKTREYYYIHEIEQSNVHDLIKTLNKVHKFDDELKLQLKDASLRKIESMVENWTINPELISQSNELRIIVNKLIEIYPDSSIAQNIHKDFERSEATLTTEFNTLFSQFKKSRTVIANAYKETDTKNLAHAYKLSNTLFPLLARFESITKDYDSEQKIKAQRLLNIYQYQLNNITEGSNQRPLKDES